MNFQKASIFAVEKLLMNTPAKPRTTTRNQQPTKSQLEATIRELKAALKEAQEKETQHHEPQHHDESFDELKHALEEAHRKEGALQQQLTDLQSELQHQNQDKNFDELKHALEEAHRKEGSLQQQIADLQSESPHHNQDKNFDELKHALEEAHRKEGALQQQVSDLQSELQHQKKLVHKLKTEIEKLEQIKSDFEQAKKAALQLAEVNEKLMQEIKTLTKEKEKEVIPTKMNISVESMPARPIQKESEKQVDFATKSWLL